MNDSKPTYLSVLLDLLCVCAPVLFARTHLLEARREFGPSVEHTWLVTWESGSELWLELTLSCVASRSHVSSTVVFVSPAGRVMSNPEGKCVCLLHMVRESGGGWDRNTPVSLMHPNGRLRWTENCHPQEASLDPDCV